jgi:hypothetical protein
MLPIDGYRIAFANAGFGKPPTNAALKGNRGSDPVPQSSSPPEGQAILKLGHCISISQEPLAKLVRGFEGAQHCDTA